MNISPNSRLTPDPPPDTGNIIQLRELLREKFPQAHRLPETPGPEPGLPTGLASLDTQTGGGGLPKGRITEITSDGRENTAGALLIAALLESTLVASSSSSIGLIDGADSLDPQSLGGLDLHHLLWVRCRTAVEAVKAADLLLRDGNLPLVVLDLQFNPLPELTRIPSSTWHRLRALAEKTGAAFLALTPSPRLIPNTHLRFSLTNQLTLDHLDWPRPELIETQLTLELTRRQSSREEQEETERLAALA